jgi:ribonuclease VapC
MVVDSSAVVAIILGEPAQGALVEALLDGDPVISAATMFEASMVMGGRLGERAFDKVDELLDEAEVRIVAVDRTQVEAARAGWLRYGRGRHRAGLNFGDCFSYALATTRDLPLLYVGTDFARTDVRSAL